MAKAGLEKKVIIAHAVLFFFIIGFFLYSNFMERAQQISSEQELDEKDLSSIEHLIGTCPRNRLCTTPSCPMWSDINEDGICDRSVR